MKHFILSTLLLIFSLSLSFGQYVTLQPSGVGPDNEATIIFDASEGNGELRGASKVYVHHGVVISGPDGTDWNYVVGNWGQDDGVGEMTKVDGEADQWQITFSPSIREYFGVPQGTDIFRISCVFRSADGNTKGTLPPGDYGWGTVAGNQDVYIDLNVNNFITLNSPLESEVFVESGESIQISAEASSSVTEMSIQLDEGSGYETVASITSGTSIMYSYSPIASVQLGIKISATINGETLETEKFLNIVFRKDTEIEALPDGSVQGVNYHAGDDTKATLVLLAPGKDFVHVAGDFTEWQTRDEYQMKKTPDGEFFWLEISDLVPGQRYVYQYWIDGQLQVGDPYARLVADPWNDQYIDEDKFPGIPTYDKTEYGTASILQTGQEVYQWAPSENTWERPDVDHLMIYELLVRDFVGTSSYEDLIDTLSYIKNLGVNAIELMPISEFEGNDSWGYNPSYYFAPDKYYGTPEDLKRLVETAHEMGMAVILDMVLNHAYGQNPMVEMYFDSGRPAADNPWFNRDYVGPYSWGYDFNHESDYTKDFIDDVNRYWLEEFHFDGYRFDFTKGFTNYAPNNNIDGFDQSRIDILKRMADEIWEVDSTAYVILEHWSPLSEELILADYGMKLWRNKSYDFVPVTTGNITGNFNGTDATSHISFFDSHDERRIAEHCLTEGRSLGSYNIKDPVVMYERVKQAAAFAFLLPGPKMMWQFDELGYDIDINFNDRVGRKPLPWGEGSLMYYEDPLRQNIYKTYQGILDVRNTFGPENMYEAETNHIFTGTTRRLVYDMDETDLVVIGNFGLDSTSMNPAFTQTGTWYDYFSGEEINVDDPEKDISLAAGEWHIFTTERLSDGVPGAVAVYANPVTISPYPFTMDDEITITFDASIASPDGTDGLMSADKVYMHAGIVEGSPDNTGLTYVIGNLTDDGVGEMTKVEGEDDKWQMTIVPGQYFDTPEDLEVFKLGMYFRDADNTNRGMGFRNSVIFFDVTSSGQFVWIDPVPFESDTEITVYFNAAKGNRELVGADKVYMHSGMSVIDSDHPASNAWNNAVGNWGMDDGVGQMTRVAGEENIWNITLTPTSYYGLSVDDTPTWLAAVFRSADGNLKGTGEPGELSNGFIADNLDFFIKNKATTSIESVNELPYEIYPNPTSGLINLSQFPDKGQFTLYDLTGKKLLSEKVTGQKLIDVSHLEKGIFLYHISTDEGVKSGKIMHL